jgi:hypothetical protein
MKRPSTLSENNKLSKLIEDLTVRVIFLEERLSSLEDEKETVELALDTTNEVMLRLFSTFLPDLDSSTLRETFATIQEQVMDEAMGDDGINASGDREDSSDFKPSQIEGLDDLDEVSDVDEDN